MTSPSIGTIRVLCDSPHQIIVTLTCTNNCINPLMTSNGNSPLTVRGLDPGIMYSVTINVFNGNQVVFRNETVMKTITVIGDQSGKIICICTYVCCTYVRYSPKVCNIALARNLHTRHSNARYAEFDHSRVTVEG